LTRDKRLKIYDDKLQRQREVPLGVVKEIQCKVKKEWLEKEWKFKETTNDQKLYTGYTYPTREYLHTITLRDGRTISGPLSAIVYVEPPRYAPARPNEDFGRPEAERFLLNKRNKGNRGQDLKSLVYVNGSPWARRLSRREGKNKRANMTMRNHKQRNENCEAASGSNP